MIYILGCPRTIHISCRLAITNVLNLYSFIHSGHFYSAPSCPLLLRGAPHYSTDTASEFHAEAHRQLAHAQCPYMAARAGVEHTTLRLRVFASTNAPPCPICFLSSTCICVCKELSMLYKYYIIIINQGTNARR